MDLYLYEWRERHTGVQNSLLAGAGGGDLGNGGRNKFLKKSRLKISICNKILKVQIISVGLPIIFKNK